MKDRSVWPECRDSGTHDQCVGWTDTSECVCWHHVVHQRHVERALNLLVEIERELSSVRARLPHSSCEAAVRLD